MNQLRAARGLRAGHHRGRRERALHCPARLDAVLAWLHSSGTPRAHPHPGRAPPSLSSARLALSASFSHSTDVPRSSSATSAPVPVAAPWAPTCPPVPSGPGARTPHSGHPNGQHPPPLLGTMQPRHCRRRRLGRGERHKAKPCAPLGWDRAATPPPPCRAPFERPVSLSSTTLAPEMSPHSEHSRTSVLFVAAYCRCAWGVRTRDGWRQVACCTCEGPHATANPPEGSPQTP